MIVADTSAIVALVDADDRHHSTLRELFLHDPRGWVLPWAILPEVDYLLARYLGERSERAFLEDLAAGAYDVEWGEADDMARARDLDARYQSLCLGLVDAVVLAVAERLRASAIATLDVRHFGAVEIEGRPALLPRDS